MGDGIAGRSLELLAPAGSPEALRAVFRAGADAAYFGGDRFSARAYAENFSDGEVLDAIDYAHARGKRAYLAVNTLLKEVELSSLYEYILPFYRQGLDACIVQDLGALSAIRSWFPDLPIHASTQMFAAGPDGARVLRSLGARRVVLPRELSMREVREVASAADMEIECFVHGALCYSYSGMCLFSSMLGGRSGNRGRCAQPCRLPYEICDGRGDCLGGRERGGRPGHRAANMPNVANGGNAYKHRHGKYVLSLKDLCLAGDIPFLYESGATSLKIEGRMKQAEYAAGVVEVYRSCVDRYAALLGEAGERGLSGGEACRYARERYRLLPEERERLLLLGNRCGFTDGYFVAGEKGSACPRSGEGMVTFEESRHRADAAAAREAKGRFLGGAEKEALYGIPVKGSLSLKKGMPAVLKVSCGEVSCRVEGDVVQEAESRPLDGQQVSSRIKKTGNTPFFFEELSIDMDSDIFLAAQSLNRLKRDALEGLEGRIAESYRRGVESRKSAEPALRGGDAPRGIGGYSGTAALQAAPKASDAREMQKQPGQRILASSEPPRQRILALSEPSRPLVFASVEMPCQLGPVLGCGAVDGVILDCALYDRKDIPSRPALDAALAHRRGKMAIYGLPTVFRDKTARFYRKVASDGLLGEMDGVLAGSLDALGFLIALRGEEAGISDMTLRTSPASWDAAQGNGVSNYAAHGNGVSSDAAPGNGASKDAALGDADAARGGFLVWADGGLYAWNDAAKRCIRSLAASCGTGGGRAAMPEDRANMSDGNGAMTQDRGGMPKDRGAILYGRAIRVMDSVPPELGKREIAARDNRGSAMTVYGRAPLMRSAQCVRASVFGCDGKGGTLFLRDRKGERIPVKSNCAECYCTVYNAVPLALFDRLGEILDMGVGALRLSFTTEDEKETERVLGVFEGELASCGAAKRSRADGTDGADGAGAMRGENSFTRGRYNGGVE